MCPIWPPVTTRPNWRPDCIIVYFSAFPSNYWRTQHVTWILHFPRLHLQTFRLGNDQKEISENDQISIWMFFPEISVQLFSEQHGQRELRVGRHRHGADEADLRLRHLVTPTANYSGQHRRSDRGCGNFCLKPLFLSGSKPLLLGGLDMGWISIECLVQNKNTYDFFIMKNITECYIWDITQWVNFTRQFDNMICGVKWAVLFRTVL